MLDANIESTFSGTMRPNRARPYEWLAAPEDERREKIDPLLVLNVPDAPLTQLLIKNLRPNAWGFRHDERTSQK